MNRYLLFTMAAGAALLASGCATPVISKNVRGELTPNVTFKSVLSDPDAHKGERVLWGGEVLGLKNEKGGSTLEVLQEPIDTEGAPTLPDKSQGRFLAFVDQYLDPAVYTHRKQVTVAGRVRGKQVTPLGKELMEYSYPVLDAEHLYIWAKRLVVSYADYDPFWWGSWGGFGGHGPAWGSAWGMDFSYHSVPYRSDLEEVGHQVK
jgi:outer membrane lipoprotein